MPKASPTDSDDPDRAVTPHHNPLENERETPKMTAPASSGAIAAEATATPSSETAIAALRSAAPELGIGDSARRVRTTWEKELAAHLDRHKRYPSDRSHAAAEILIRFALDRAGHVLSASIVQSSGDKSFDEAALAMMRRADPVPPPPALVADDGLTFTMPVIFKTKPRN